MCLPPLLLLSLLDTGMVVGASFGIELGGSPSGEKRGSSSPPSVIKTERRGSGKGAKRIRRVVELEWR